MQYKVVQTFAIRRRGVKRPASFRILGAAAIFSAAALSSSLLAANGAGTPRVTIPVPTADQARILLAQAADRPVSYAENQADRGARLFKTACAECHGDDLRGGLIGGPPLRGLAFEKKFAAGTPASALFAFTSSQMPPDAPGQFSAGEYADMIAFLLRENGFGAAGAPLPSNTDALDHLIVDK
jgi:S-disulfanyl-L-cysteine oxidoreductase SoxD